MLTPAHGSGRGPKSAFRYALLEFGDGAAEIRLKQVRADGIFYPVQSQESFTGGDRKLNRIWESSVYTAHLCMQEGIWDAPKRDRGIWMGDLDVTGQVIARVFGSMALLDESYEQLAADGHEHINGLATYTPFWIIGEARLQRQRESDDELRKLHPQLLRLLQLMAKEINADGRFEPSGKAGIFIDWAPELDRDTPEARAAAQMEYAWGFREGAQLLEELKDPAAEEMRQLADKTTLRARQDLFDAKVGGYGSRWQTNALAVVSGVATAEQARQIGDGVLAGVGRKEAPSQPITPWQGYYLLEALA